MKKTTLIDAEQNISNVKQAESIEDVVNELSEMIGEMLPESSDFQEFEKETLELGNELVKRVLKKN